jgi:membrane-associated PAP2 superfamily phosphatase
MTNQRRFYELITVLFLASVTTLVFWLTDWDYRLASIFYHPENPDDVWPLQHAWFLKLLFDYAFPFTVAAGGGALLVFLLSHVHDHSRRYRRQALYVLLVIALGPGLVVNLIVKDHWGRPRPVHIQEFGGEFQYVPPVKLGHTTDKSFVCGHCSVGYAFFAVYFLAQNHKLIYLALTLGLAWTMGFTRMTAGGHFVSDILWSGYLVFLVAYALYYGWYARIKPNALE